MNITAFNLNKIREQEKLLDSALAQADSYKYSHPPQYPPGTEYVRSYFESRGGPLGWVQFAGLQMILIQDFLKPLTEYQVNFFEKFITAHGEPFYKDLWMYIVEKHKGYYPLRIKAVKEGTVVPSHNVLYTVENTDPELPFLGQFSETKLVPTWYPTTVATTSLACRTVIWDYLEKTCMDPGSEIMFKLHDFGARGVSSRQSAQRGGAAHLNNFMGTDTIEGALAAWIYYGNYKEPAVENMPAFSIPAGEHSTFTSWGKTYEQDAYRNMNNEFNKPDDMFAVVSDSYDLENAIRMFCGPLKQDILSKGGRLVVRPDSGNPSDIVLNTVKLLDEGFGSEVNNKGYKVLHPQVRVIQGDGITFNSLPEILEKLVGAGYSAENVAFGMGGGLLQQCDRDTHKFAQKASEVVIMGKAQDVFKDPITDPGKRSKAGMQALTKDFEGNYITVREEELNGRENLLETVYENGELKRFQTLEEIRELVAQQIA